MLAEEDVNASLMLHPHQLKLICRSQGSFQGAKGSFSNLHCYQTDVEVEIADIEGELH